VQAEWDIPWEKFIDAIHGMSSDARQNVAKVSLRIYTVQLCRADQTVKHRSALTSAIRSREQVVLLVSKRPGSVPR